MFLLIFRAMELDLLIENLKNPALLFFFLGILAVSLRSDLEIPSNSSKFISIYLLFSIGFNGGQELAHSTLGMEIIWSLATGILLAVIVPIYSFFILRWKLSSDNASAIAAAYGSVSAVTFVTAVAYLELLDIPFGGHMVAVMALMEAPSIIVGVMLYARFRANRDDSISFGTVLSHSVTNGSVMLILGSLVIGFIASDAQAEGIKPFTTDIFKGFLAIFLLDMGITSGRNLKSFIKNGWFTFLFAIIMPLFNGLLMAWASQFIMDSDGNRLIISILAASASYIAVPAAMRLAVPKANPSLYIPMALAITFPFNITLGMPLYLSVIQSF